jgi:hypothetical protein
LEDSVEAGLEFHDAASAGVTRWEKGGRAGRQVRCAVSRAIVEGERVEMGDQRRAVEQKCDGLRSWKLLFGQAQIPRTMVVVEVEDWWETTDDGDTLAGRPIDATGGTGQVSLFLIFLEPKSKNEIDPLNTWQRESGALW